MTTFQHTGKGNTRQKFTSAFLLVLCVYVGVRAWALFSVSWIFIVLGLGILVLALLRGLDPFLSKPVLTIDENGISQSGRIWPGENWRLEWESVSGARLYGEETPTALALSAKRVTRLVMGYASFEQVVQLVREQLEKRGCPLEK
jgi:hypothetical protein